VIATHARFGRVGLVAAVAAATCFAAGAHGAAPSKLIECQHPVRTGEEAYALKQVTAKVACPLVRALARWEYVPGHVEQHIKQLYRCAGASKRSPGHPVLVLTVFEGWQLSITPSGAFRMSRGPSSFEVTGTDFPLNCT
jgi:hypothetical protein